MSTNPFGAIKFEEVPGWSVHKSYSSSRDRKATSRKPSTVTLKKAAKKGEKVEYVTGSGTDLVAAYADAVQKAKDFDRG